MANLTNIIGGQPYYSAAAGNSKNTLLDFWKGTQAEYDALAQTGGTTASNPGAASTVDFTVTSSSAFTVGDVVYVTGTAPGNTTRTQGTVDSLPDTTSIVVAFSPSYTSNSSAGYTIDLYDPKTLYLITA